MSGIKNYFIDLLALIGLLIALEPRMTGISFHEWFALALAGLIVIHIVIHWQWVANVTRRFFKHINDLSRWKYTLDTAVFISFTIAIFSGFMVSESVLPYFGLARSTNVAWRNLHSVSSYLTLILIACHVAMNWAWVKKTSRSVVSAPAARYRTLDDWLSREWISRIRVEKIPIGDKPKRRGDS